MGVSTDLPLDTWILLAIPAITNQHTHPWRVLTTRRDRLLAQVIFCSLNLGYRYFPFCPPNTPFIIHQVFVVATVETGDCLNFVQGRSLGGWITHVFSPCILCSNVVNPGLVPGFL